MTDPEREALVKEIEAIEHVLNSYSHDMPPEAWEAALALNDIAHRLALESSLRPAPTIRSVEPSPNPSDDPELSQLRNACSLALMCIENYERPRDPGVDEYGRRYKRMLPEEFGVPGLKDVLRAALESTPRDGTTNKSAPAPSEGWDDAAVERAAKAICDDAWGGTQIWDRKPQSFCDRYRGYARAALNAASRPAKDTEGIQKPGERMAYILKKRLEHGETIDADMIDRVGQYVDMPIPTITDDDRRWAIESAKALAAAPNPPGRGELSL